MLLRFFIQMLIGVACGYTLVRLAPVIQAQWQGQQSCPALGPLPACYVVAVCYTAMAVAAIVRPRKLKTLFLTGWAPVFLLALIGSALEIAGNQTCPKAAAGIPLCFYSLALATFLLPAYLLVTRGAKDTR